MGEDDVALGELLYGAPPLDRLTNALCRGELSDACSKPPPVPPAGAREVDESFIAMDAEELRLKHMMATMQDQGMSGQVRCWCPTMCFAPQPKQHEVEHTAVQERSRRAARTLDALRACAASAEPLRC